MNLRKLLYPWLAVFLLLISCNHKDNLFDPLEFDDAFEPYISAFTSGIISKNETVKIRFTKDMLDDKGQVIDPSNLSFHLSPSVQGAISWKDSRTLEFKPANPFTPLQVYDAQVDLADLFKEKNEKPGTFKFRFMIEPIEISVSVDGLMASSEKSTDYVRLSGTMRISDPGDSAQIEEMLRITLGSSRLAPRWKHGKDGIVHYFSIDSVKKEKAQQEVKINWDGSAIGSGSKGEKTLTIPPLGVFRFIDARIEDQAKGQVTFYFTEPLNKDQDIFGLITSKQARFNFIIERNTVKAFVDGELPGYVKFDIIKGIRNVDNDTLKQTHSIELDPGTSYPQIKWVDQGVIVPSAPRVPIAFETINLSAVDIRVIKVNENNILQFFQFNELNTASYMNFVGQEVLEKKIPLDNDKSAGMKKWNRHFVNLGELFNLEKGKIYNIEIRYRRDYYTGDCAISKEDVENRRLTMAKPSGKLWDYYNYSYRYTSGEDTPCNDSYYLARGGITKNIISSDLGILAKINYNGSYLVAVTNINTAMPVSGAKVNLYAENQKLITSASTNSAGVATFKVDVNPFIALVEHGNEKGYLKFSSGSQPLGNYDVGGSYNRKDIRGYIYTDRGVWRPGDSIFVSFILEDKQKLIPIDHPLLFELYNPRGQLVQKILNNTSVNNIYCFKLKTNLNDPTGVYLTKINAGGAEFTKNLKIETIIPNRLKLDFEPLPTVFSASSESAGKIKANWLHGAPAKDLFAEVFAQMKPIPDYFNASFKEYAFEDPIRDYNGTSDIIFSGKLDESGRAVIPNIYKSSKDLPGVMNMSLFFKVTEPGGNFSTDNFSTTYLPFDHYVGIKVPKGDGDIGVLFTDETQTVDLVTVDKNAKLANSTIQVQLYRMRWRWWWDYYEEDRSYNGRISEVPVASKNIRTVNGKATWSFKIPQREYGRYLIRATDASGHVTGKIVYLDNSAWYNRRPEKNADNMLTVSTDKKKYAPGDMAKIDFPSSGQGSAFITIEKGDKVVHYEWLKTSKGRTSYSFKITPEMSPNCYVSVSLLQSYAEKTNDLPIRLLGITPVFVEDPMTRLQPVISLPPVLRPEQKCQVKISEKDGKAMTYTIAMVDEGLLDLTKFKTPDPWNFFFSKEALNITTFDLFNSVAKTEKQMRLLEIGGDADESAEPGEGTKVQRFKPMVRFLGPFMLRKGQTATHSIDIPQYVGSVRTMVVAGDYNAYGASDTTTPVRSPLMILATLPRVLGPGESVDMPISVFAMDPKLKQVKVEVKINDLLISEFTLTKNVFFQQQGEQNITFPLKVAKKLGIARVKIHASSGTEVANYDMEVQVRTPNPMTSKNTSLVVLSTEAKAIDFEAFGLKGSNKGTLEVSGMPPLNLESRLQYLIEYPHGCIEQTTSAVFPQLFLSDIIELEEWQKAEIERNINAGLHKLYNFQLSNGGFGYWPGEGGVTEWGTNYAGHFMVEAFKKGYTIPAGMMDNWIRYQKSAANNWGNYKSNAPSELTQAYRLYELALAGFPESGAMNRLRNNITGTTAKWLLAGAYYLAGQRSTAAGMIKNLNADVIPYRELGYTYGSNLRDKAIILEVLSMMKRQYLSTPLMLELSNALMADHWMSTQETGYILLAIGKYVDPKNVSDKSIFSFQYRVNKGEWIKVKQHARYFKTAIDLEKIPKGKVEIKNDVYKMLYANVTMRGIAVDDAAISADKGMSMSVDYFNMRGEEIDPSILNQGTDFYSEIRINMNYLDLYVLNEVALSSIFPSGWQIYNPRLSGHFKVRTSNAKYMDVRDDRVYVYFDLYRYYDQNYWRYNEDYDEEYDESDDNAEITINDSEEGSGSNGNYGRNYYYYDSGYDRYSLVFRIALNASYTGTYYLPPVYAETMYDKSIHASVPGRWVHVVKSTANP